MQSKDFSILRYNLTNIQGLLVTRAPKIVFCSTLLQVHPGAKNINDFPAVHMQSSTNCGKPLNYFCSPPGEGSGAQWKLVESTIFREANQTAPSKRVDSAKIIGSPIEHSPSVDSWSKTKKVKRSLVQYVASPFTNI